MMFLWFGFAQDDLGDRVESLLDDSFGFGVDASIEVENIDNDNITIRSDIVFWELWEKILDYSFMYWEYDIQSAIWNTDLLDEFEEKNISIDENDNSFEIEFNKDDDNIDPDKIYYMVAVPKDEFGIPWEISNEICFILDNQIYWEWSDCKDSDTNSNHGAAIADMELANITHQINWDKITLLWTEIDGADEVEIRLRDLNDERFSTLATVNMRDERYDFTTNRNWEHNIKFIPIDNNEETWKYKIYTLTITTIDEPTVVQAEDPTPPSWGITTVPVVGPKENIIIILLVSFLAYFIFKKLFSKAK